MIFQQPPPFEPTIIEAEAILNIGFMFAEILIYLVFIILMIYLYRKVRKEYLPMLIVFLFSILIGFEGITHFHTHFSPYLEIFFLLFQSSYFLLGVLDYIELKKK